MLIQKYKKRQLPAEPMTAIRNIIKNTSTFFTATTVARVASVIKPKAPTIKVTPTSSNVATSSTTPAVESIQTTRSGRQVRPPQHRLPWCFNYKSLPTPQSNYFLHLTLSQRLTATYVAIIDIATMAIMIWDMSYMLCMPSGRRLSLVVAEYKVLASCMIDYVSAMAYSCSFSLSLIHHLTHYESSARPSRQI